MKLSVKSISIAAAIFIASVIFASFIGCERIDAGNVGIKVNAAGGDRGISKTQYVTGIVTYLKPLTRIYEFPTFIQHKDYEPFTVPSKGGTIFTVHPTFNYNLNAGNIADMFSTFRKPLNELEEGYLKNALLVSLREVTNTFTVDSILNNLAGYDVAVLNKLNAKLDPYFIVSTFTSGLVPDEKLAAVITAKAQTIQEALQLENEQKKIKVEVENQLLVAKKDSAIKVMNATAEATSIKVKQEALSQSPQYVELTKAERWDGKLPQYIMGNGTGMFMSIK